MVNTKFQTFLKIFLIVALFMLAAFATIGVIVYAALYFLGDIWGPVSLVILLILVTAAFIAYEEIK